MRLGIMTLLIRHARADGFGISVWIRQLLLLTLLNRHARADENTLLTNNKPTITCILGTSNSYLANTVDNIMATFQGSFSQSGPHDLGNFPVGGARKSIAVTLQTPIGELQQILFEKKGADAWLLASISCSMGNVGYELSGERQWLDVGAIEPNLQEYPAGDTYTVIVKNQHQLFSNQGLMASTQ